MYKLIDYFKYIFFICCLKISDLCKKLWWKKKSDPSDFVKDLRADVVLLNVEKYQSLFASPTQYPQIFMPKPIFEKTVHNLPPNYVLPDLKTLKKIIEAYNKPAPDLNDDARPIDHQVLEKIKASLPGYYILPLPVSVKSEQSPLPVVSKSSISLVKTFVPKVSADLYQRPVSENSGNILKPEVPSPPAVTFTPLASNKKIIKPVPQQDPVDQESKYKFIFFE